MSLEGMLHSDQEIRGRISGMSVIHTDAYEIALRNGFEGTVEEWLASLSGADWNAAEGEPGHIKNRTHWDDCEEVAFVEDKTVNKTGYTTVSWLTYDKVKDCTTARVIFNGVEYVCPVTVKINFTEYGDESYFYIGNFQDGAPQYPFCFWGYILNNFAIVNAEDGTHTVSIYGRKEVVHKLPEKYLPDYIKTVNGIEPDEDGNVEISVGGGTGGNSGGNADYVGVEPAEDDIPKVFFGGALQQTKDEKVVPFRYISKTDDFSGYVEIKAQGNSSMNYAKKNQTVKMFKDAACEEKLKVDFKGWGKQNKHCYKANWIDLSHARNVVSARLWADVVKSRNNYAELPELLRTTPNQGAVDGFPIKVYADGVYQGRYTLNIPKDKWTFNMDDDLEEHCVLCGENYASGCFRASAQINESDWTDEIHETVPASVKTRWNEVISFVMNSTDEEFKANLGNYFFVDSLIDYYLYGLASCGLDAFGKNQIYATYDGQKWIASMYDMDSTWGLYWNGSKFVDATYARTSFEDMVNGRQGNLLYMRLEQLFCGELKARWEELKKGALSIENIINRFERFTDITPDELVKEDYASTTGGGKFTGIPSQSTNNIQQIRAFALARQAWTDAYIVSITPVIPVPCTGISLNTNTLSFTAEGTQTLTATVAPDGCTDSVFWESNNSSVATVENGTVTALANGNAIIMARCGNYSASCSVAVSGIVEPVPCTGISVNKTELAFDGGGTETLTATVTPSNTTDKVVWRSDDTRIATVTDGVVTPVKSGSCNIVATCGEYSASCTVTVTNLGIDYTMDALANATWLEGYEFNRTTQDLKAVSGACVTEPFTLQACMYEYNAGSGNTWNTVVVYDSDGNYVMYFQPQSNGIYRFYGVQGYKYRISLSNSGESYKTATLKPVDNSANAEYASFDLSALTWKAGSVNTCTWAEATVPEDLKNALLNSDQCNTNIQILKSGFMSNTHFIAKTPEFFVLSVYAGIYYLHTSYFTTGEAAAEYFAQNNTVLEFNKRYQ